ncbi:MAG: cupin domain-containing protein [Actinobacteria bacterium]|nr:MAG: cupin domain-containing protein [Actinomycetota bacterium]
MSNVWEDVPDWGGVGALRLERLTALGASVWELQPGGVNWNHFHHGSEELLIVLRGRPTLRTPEGERVLAEGDVVTFPRGPAGAKEIRNDGDEVARVVIVSTNAVPDVSEYPDVGKVGMRIDDDEWKLFRPSDAVEYYD